MKTFKSLVCAALLVGSSMPASAGIMKQVGRVYDNGLKVSALGLAAYPFVDICVKGVSKPMLFGRGSTTVPVVEYLAQLSRPELVEFVANTSVPYVPYAVALLLAGYAAKKTAKYAFDSK